MCVTLKSIVCLVAMGARILQQQKKNGTANILWFCAKNAIYAHWYRLKRIGMYCDFVRTCCDSMITLEVISANMPLTCKVVIAIIVERGDILTK